MSEWFTGQFEEGDIRKTASDLLEKGISEGLDAESIKELGNAYGELCNTTLVKLHKLIEEHNPTVPLAAQYISQPLTYNETGEKLTEYYKYHASFMDMMLTLLLVRRIEAACPVKEPFTFDPREGVTSHVK